MKRPNTRARSPGWLVAIIAFSGRLLFIVLCLYNVAVWLTDVALMYLRKDHSEEL